MMKNFDESLRSFLGDMDILFKDMVVSEDLKSRVKDRISMETAPYRRGDKSFKRIVSFISIILIICIFQIPIVRAQTLSTVYNVISWIRETTSLPIYLPDLSQLIEQDITKMDSDIKNYYYELVGDVDFYNINIYRVKTPINFNDRNDLLEKNGPVSEADFIGAIRGERITGLTPELLNRIPKDAESFELIPGIKAYKKEQGTRLWWEHKKWNFEFSGSSHSYDILKELAAKWDKATIEVSEMGKVIIVEGNKLTFEFIWINEGYQYTYRTTTINFDQTIDILNDFTRIDASTIGED